MLMGLVGGVESLNFNHQVVNKILEKWVTMVFTMSSILSFYSEFNSFLEYPNHTMVALAKVLVLRSYQ